MPASAIAASPFPLLACPACRSALSGDASLTCANGHRFGVTDGIPQLVSELGTATTLDLAPWDAKYAVAHEPYRYSARAAEVLKHEWTADLARRLVDGHAGAVLDIGCSLGQLTERLAGFAESVVAVDLSSLAVRRARTRITDPAIFKRITFAAGSATALPVPRGAFDLVLLSDGLHSWELPDSLRIEAIRQAHDAAKPGAPVLFLDYMNPRHFDRFVGWVRDSPLQIEAIHHLHDRAWFVLESTFKAFERVPGHAAIRRSVPFARALARLSRPLGARGSKHVCIQARRPK